MSLIENNNFTRDFHILTALICHLSATHWRSRTPSEIAGSLAMERNEVERVLLAYPGFFRESKNRKEGTKERMFTVHFRYALRRKDPETNKTVSDELTSEHISVMLNLLTEMITAESEERRLEKDIKVRKFNIKLTAAVAIASALIGLSAGLLSSK
jgi:hypothetical protein